MPLSIVYETQSSLLLGQTFSSSHVINDSKPGDKVIYSATTAIGVKFNNQTGDFIVNSSVIGTIHFVITVIINNKFGFNIPIQIEITDPDRNSLSYSFITNHPYLTNIKQMIPNISTIETYTCSYYLIGAPRGITIDKNTGIISGKPSHSGHFVMTVNVFDEQTNIFICTTVLNLMYHTSNEITSILDFLPGNNLIHSKNTILKLRCSYIGTPPPITESGNFALSCPAFNATRLADYNISDELHFTYIVDISNCPGSYPLRIENLITGTFIQSEHMFTVTAACFNEDTTILTMNKGTEEYKAIKDIEVGDEVITYQHGIKKVTHIGSNTFVNNPATICDCMYRLSATNENYENMTHDLILLGRHSTLVDELTSAQKRKIMEIHPVDLIDDKVLLNSMFNEDFEIVNDEKTYTYYHLVLEREKDKMDRRYGIYVNGGGVIAATSYKKDFLKQFG